MKSTDESGRWEKFAVSGNAVLVGKGKKEPHCQTLLKPCWGLWHKFKVVHSSAWVQAQTVGSWRFVRPIKWKGRGSTESRILVILIVIRYKHLGFEVFGLWRKFQRRRLKKCYNAIIRGQTGRCLELIYSQGRGWEFKSLIMVP